MHEATACHLLRGDGENREMLLGQRAPTLFCGGRWAGPGGKLDKGERIPIGLRREVREEIKVNIDLKTAIHFATVDFYHPYCGSHKLEWRVYFFRAFAWKGEPQTSGEIVDLKWFPINSLPYEKMMPGHESWLPMTMNGNCAKHVLMAEIFFTDPDLGHMDRGTFKFVPRV